MTEEQKEKKQIPGAVSPQTQLPPDVPEEVKQSVQKTVSEFAMMSYAGPLPNPLIAKMTPEHLTTMINKSAEQDRRTDYLTFAYYFFSLAAILGLIVVLLYLGKDSLIVPIVIPILTFLAGFGIGRYKK